MTPEDTQAMQEAAREAVAKGVALLDQERPGWESEVDLERLAMGDCDDCILGQLYQDFTKGIWALFTDARGYTDYEVSDRFGFDTPEALYEHDDFYHDALGREWGKVIKARRVSR